MKGCDVHRKLSDVLISPYRMDMLDIISKLNGISRSEIEEAMTFEALGFERHLTRLLEEDLIRCKGKKYYSTKKGKEVHNMMIQMAGKTGRI